MNELQKTIEMQRKDIQDLKLRHKDEILALEKERNLLQMENKELEFKLKQQRLTLDAEKLEIMNKLIRFEADKLSLEKELKTRQNDLAQIQSLQQMQNESKVLELQRKLDIMKEEHLNEVKSVRQEGDKSVLEIKVIYEQEIDKLKSQIVAMNGKLRETSTELESLQAKDNSSMFKSQIKVLEEALDHYKTLTKQSTKLADKDEFRSFNSDLFASKDSYTSRPYRKTYEDEINLPFNPKVPVEYQKFVNEIERLRELNEKLGKEKEENEKKLKNEIKYLIGKLLKAKSKISTKGELTENLRRESMMNTLRSTGFDRTSLPLKSSRKISRD